ncbi:hypothetical protein NPIL_164951 [Nephila pilipes]|uniref:Uncharacterized protein n=1 Tax=Nephila pilipes TaxID=299642 RepID=A0A8X6U2F5_NEPPI|nr:hypothetical protein NPIL_164951 [Nephila pilipes]
MQHVGRVLLTSSDHQMRYRTDVPDTKIMGLRLELRILRLGDKGWATTLGDVCHRKQIASNDKKVNRVPHTYKVTTNVCSRKAAIEEFKERVKNTLIKKITV